MRGSRPGLGRNFRDGRNVELLHPRSVCGYGAVRQAWPSQVFAADDRHGAVSPQYGQEDGQEEEAVSATRSFEVVEAGLNGAPGVAVRGEIDVDAVPSLESALDAAIRCTAGAFVLDLCDLDFLDSSGLRVMLRARARLAREDRELAIVCPPGSVRRLFEVVGIADLLFFYASREDAAAALVPAA
jgi:anti-sigma B factor antagonist